MTTIVPAAAVIGIAGAIGATWFVYLRRGLGVRRVPSLAHEAI